MPYKDILTIYPGRYENNNSHFDVKLKGKCGIENTVVFVSIMD